MSKPVLTLEASGKHTRGPWRAMAGDDLVFVARPNIAHVGVTGGRAYKAPFVIVGNPGPKGSEYADARLIAASPDMLAALIAVRARFQHLRLGPDEEKVLARVSAAIALATPEEGERT